MEEKNMSEKESIELISRMIEETKTENDAKPGNSLLWWGYSAVATCIVIFLINWLTDGMAPNWLTFLIGACGYLVPFIRQLINQHRHKAITHIDHAIHCMWESLAIAFAGYGLYFIVQQLLNYSISALSSMYLIMILFGGIASGFTFAIYKIKSVIVGGVTGIFIYMYFPIIYPNEFMKALACPQSELMMAFLMAFLLILPGYYLNNKAKNGDIIV